MEALELLSWIAGILSCIVTIIWLFLIKPIYNHYKNKISNNINENNTWNTLNINWDYINQKIISGGLESLSPNQNENGN